MYLTLLHVLDIPRFRETVTHANVSAGLCMQTVHADGVVSSLMSYIKFVFSCCGGYPSMLTKCCSRIDRCAGVLSQRFQELDTS